MRFGCSSLLYGGHDLDTAIAGLQAAGFEAIELCAMPGFGEHFKPGEDPAVYADIRARLDAAGLYLEAVGCSGSLGTERFEPLVAAAAALGAPFMTLGSGGVCADEEAWPQMLQTVREALPIAAAAGLRLAFKPHVRAAVCDTATALRFLADLDSPLVGLNIDNTHLERGGDDPVAAVETLRDHIFTARIRDYRSDDLSVGLVENQIPGKGAADVAGYLRALASVPGLQYAVLEMGGTDTSGAALTSLEPRQVQALVGEALVALQGYAQ